MGAVWSGGSEAEDVTSTPVCGLQTQLAAESEGPEIRPAGEFDIRNSISGCGVVLGNLMIDHLQLFLS
jgi:hypothetical protein